MSNAARSITLGQSDIGAVIENAHEGAENPALVPPDRPKRKRMELSLQRKMDVVNAYSDGMSQKQISAATGIARSTVNDIVNKQVLSPQSVAVRYTECTLGVTHNGGNHQRRSAWHISSHTTRVEGGLRRL